ncbi:hypothetical protein RhiirC2_782401 [Rhizophagus irregularis]|uniref:Uncharacterized protein n=1 Tax=Rhizophagus irregularis TaxID=588596 RepID=A0A2N1N358_9GLOM|nr:hypothetical protein RhiirC2_782401 [Rhizophagus irregularis]
MEMRIGNHNLQRNALSAASPLFPSTDKSNYALAIAQHLFTLTNFNEAFEMFSVHFVKQNIIGNVINEAKLKANIKAAQSERDQIDLLLSEYLDDTSISQSEHAIDSRYVSLKSGIYAKLAKTALSIGQNLEFNFEQSCELYSDLKFAKNKLKLNDIELIQKVIKTLAESDNINEKEDNEYEDSLFDKSKSHIEKSIQKIINSKIIPNDNVNIDNIPKDLDDDFIDNEKNNNDENIVLTDDKIIDDINGRGILNYNVNNLLNKYVNKNQ